MDHLEPFEFESEIKFPNRNIPYDAELEHQLAILKANLFPDKNQIIVSRRCRTMRDITP